MVIDPTTAALRIGLALLFGAIIGVEREWRHKVAGIKTNALVAFGAAAFAMMSDTFGPTNHNPAQLAAAVVTGIGFIGAGVIIHRGANVQGVTTAATLWSCASMGVAIGLGRFVVAIFVFVAILVVQFGMRAAVAAVEARRGPGLHHVEVRIECNDAALAAVNDAWAEFAKTTDITPLRHSTTRSETSIVWQSLFTARGLDLGAFERRLSLMPGVQKFEARHTGPADEV